MNTADFHQQDSALILVVDDDKFTRVQLRASMVQAGYRVVEAIDGEQALFTYTRLHPDIVLLDALMPVMDGFTCCTQLRTIEHGDRTPVLMITALEDQESVDRAFEVGATDFITKPIHWAVLRQRVRRLLEASRATAKLQQQTQRAQQSEAHFRLALAAAHMGTWDWDLVSGKITLSDDLKPLFCLSPGSFDGTYQGFIARVHPEDRELVEQAVRRAVADGNDYNIEFRVVKPDGTIRVGASLGQVYYDDGKAVRMTGIDMDITKRKQAEEKLQQTTMLQRAILESANYTIISTSVDGTILTFNSAAERWLGYAASEVVNKATPLLIHDWDEIVKQAQELSQEIGVTIEPGFEVFVAKARLGKPDEREWSYIRKDGSRFPVLLSITRLTNAEGEITGFLGIGSDITERKRAAEELQRSQMRSQLFSDITLKIRTSLQIEEIIQTTVTEVQKLLQADRVVIFRLRSDGYGKIVTESVLPGWASVLGRGIVDDCFGEEYIKRYIQGRIYTISDISQAEVPSCLVEFMQQFSVKAKLVMPILLKQELWGLLIVHQCTGPRQWTSSEIDLLRQIADQIGIALAQAQLLEQETRYSQELIRSNAELQQFASIASHDLQEPLRKIQAFGNRLKAVCGDRLGEQGHDYLERMQNAARRMQSLIDDLLILSRITTRAQPFVRVNLAEVTQEVLSDLEVRLQQSGGRVEVGELPTIEADPVQMRQLLQNLISNALKFHQRDSQPLVKIYSQLLNHDHAPVDGFAETEFCQIIVEDHGIGFDEKYLNRIFNVFQRLHSRSEYEGTGIGLTICRKIAERHDGNITAKSQPGHGATFIVTLPIQQPRGENTE